MLYLQLTAVLMEKIKKFTKIFDDNTKIKILDKIKLLNEDPQVPGWKYTGYSNSNKADKRFWYLELNNDKFFTDYLFKIIKQKILEETNENVELLRVYLNGNTACTQGYFHVDGEANERTFLIYCNHTWNIEDGGGTIFYEQDKKQYLTFQALPLSCLYFNADIQHSAQSISRDFDGLRVTAAFKLRIKINNEPN